MTADISASSEIEMERLLNECYLKNILDLNTHRNSSKKRLQYVVDPLFVADIIQSQRYISDSLYMSI